MREKRKKTLTAIGAVAMAAVIGLGGTFAWQSISQQALNEVADVVNPGGRLHDDFDGRNKDVYVENFTDAENGTPIFARVRLDEYMELGTGAGTDRNLTKDQPLTKTGLTVVGQGSKINDKSTWITRKPGGGSAFEKYYTWDMEGGQTVYMPTFNKNKDSLKADINGTYDGKTDTNVPYDDYVTYTAGQQITDDATYDDDNNDVEDDGVRTENETHTATNTIDGTVITMEEWVTRWIAYQTALKDDPQTNPADYNVQGDFWVWDADGWAYWANPIQPGTATGLLLDGIELTDPPSDSFYYGINAVGQFVTADDIGHLNGTGFYDTTDGKSTIPSDNAETLIELITGSDIDITRVEISGADSINKGSYKTYTATVLKGGAQAENASVEWSVEGNKSDSTAVSKQSNGAGKLTIAADEPSDEVTIVATYTPEAGKTVSARKKVSLVTPKATISISASSDDPVLPGNTLELTAKVSRGSASISADTVTWSISGNTDPNTKLSSETGASVTVTIAENEARGPFTVTASFYDEARSETVTNTFSVTADVPVPLDKETSQAIRDANIENIGLDGEYDDYAIVNVGSAKAYVLAVDEEHNRALLGMRYSSKKAYFDYSMSNNPDIPWAVSTIRTSYIPGRLDSNPTLNASVIPTEIYTRKTDSHPNHPQVPKYEDCILREEGLWTVTMDKMFLFTEADIRGTDYWANPSQDNSQFIPRYPAADVKDFTYDGKPIIPRAILKAKAEDTFVQATLLRSPVPRLETRDNSSAFAQRRVDGTIIDWMECFPATASYGYPFIGAWVLLSPEA